MIRFATGADIASIKSLWSMSFKDSINYIDFFFDKIAAPDSTLIFEDGGTVASMLTLIPGEFVYRSNAVRAVYIYGAATHKNYRGAGLMTQLLSHGEELSRSRGCALCVLVPGEGYLFDYYKRRGYSADFSLRSVVIRHGMLSLRVRPDTENKTDELSAAELYSLREDCLKDMAHISWRAGYLKGALLDMGAYGERLDSYEGSHGRAYAVWGLDKKSLYIRECLGTTHDAQQALLINLINRLDPSSVTVQLPLRSELFKYEGENRVYGMAKPLVVGGNIKDMEAYMNLMLD